MSSDFETATNDTSPIAVLASGGLDSAILVGRLAQVRVVHPIYIQSDVVWMKAELAGLQDFLSRCQGNIQSLVVLQMPLADLYGQHWSTGGAATPDRDTPDEAVYLPGRTALLAVKAAVWCQQHQVSQLALAPLGTSPFADSSQNFFDLFSQAMNLGAPNDVQLIRPFGSMNKRQVMELGRELPLEFSFSCIHPFGDNHCGQCNKCFERQEAFRRAEIEDRTTYAAGGDTNASS